MSRAAAKRDKHNDIPTARRVYLPRRRYGLKLLVISSLVLSSSLTVALIGQHPLNFIKLQESTSVIGIGTHSGLDRHLLGHFPYAEVTYAKLVDIGPGLQVHEDVAASLKAMSLAAASDGIDLTVLSGYRSHALQKRIFFDVKSERNQTAEERAKVSAPPGYSEHSTGYAIDFGDGKEPTANLSSTFESTQAFQWLQDHAASYHFVLSFPSNNPQGVSYEPWHWRFEGSAAALLVFEIPRRLTQTRSGVPQQVNSAT